ncbi:ABC transporter substrate-binding protein [Salipiger sp. P9]|uniref:ABC transporter substrate-binding protein n=1 Tax=Salipiger pentaromativorans TaxID=2943193 RepID=UPI002157C0C1|nr:ABC transporter substrate-binding protein [Salipiger pentaromativorans]MCR8546887.1 ABC transporter substrate-binding protein [Salipiger pentaromativorans]
MLRKTCLPAACGAATLTATLAALAASTAAAEEVLISEERCALNRAAGEITFLTSYAYAATPGILDILAADMQGYFTSHCLDVTIRPGHDNIQLVSAGRAQIAGMGDPGVVMSGIANGAKIIGITTYGNQAADAIITMTDGPIKELKDLEGHIFGYKLASFPHLAAMMAAAGVETDKVKMVQVGYDPSILPMGQVDALMSYKSNEPNRLRSEGHAITVWDPTDYGVKATFNTQIANIDFTEAHPTAVEDFLRASFKGFGWITESDENLDAALAHAADLSTAGYDIELSRLRWTTEVGLIESSKVPGKPLGWQSAEQWQGEADNLTRFNLLDEVPDVETAQSGAFVDAIYEGETLVWPAK